MRNLEAERQSEIAGPHAMSGDMMRWVIHVLSALGFILPAIGTSRTFVTVIRKRQAQDRAKALKAEIDIYLGELNSARMPQAFPTSQAIQVSPNLANFLSPRVEHTCVSGSVSRVPEGTKSLLAATVKTVLVIGAETMTTSPPRAAALLGSARTTIWPVDLHRRIHRLFADVAKDHGKRYGSCVRCAL